MKTILKHIGIITLALAVCVIGIFFFACIFLSIDHHNQIVKERKIAEQKAKEQQKITEKESKTNQISSVNVEDIKKTFYKRQEWIENNIWMESKGWEKHSNGIVLYFTLWNRSKGKLKDYIILYKLYDEDGKEMFSDFSRSLSNGVTINGAPSSSVTINSGDYERHSRELIISNVPMSAVATVSFKIIGVQVEGEILPGD